MKLIQYFKLGGYMKLFLFALSLLFLSVYANADTVTIDTTGWTQEQKNMVHAMTSKLLFDSSISHAGISVSLPNINVESPSGAINGILTETNILAAFNQWKIEITAADNLALQEYQAKQTEVSSNPVTSLKLSNINAYIDSQIDNISTLAEAKVFLRQFCKMIVRYIKARE